MKNLSRSLIFFCASIALAVPHSVAGEDDAVAYYGERAVEWLSDAISRETVKDRDWCPPMQNLWSRSFLKPGSHAKH